MSIAPLIGFLGDLLTFAGGVLLAWDAVNKDKEVQRIQRLARSLAEPRLARLRLVMDGIELEHDEKNIERIFLQRSVKKAKWGCFVLTIGFALLTAARISEMAGG